MYKLIDEIGVVVYGKEALAWRNSTTRMVGDRTVRFGSGFISPRVVGEHFEFPKKMLQFNYQIHLLETGVVLVMIGKRIYECSIEEGIPKVTLMARVSPELFIPRTFQPNV